MKRFFLLKVTLYAMFVLIIVSCSSEDADSSFKKSKRIVSIEKTRINYDSNNKFVKSVLFSYNSQKRIDDLLFFNSRTSFDIGIDYANNTVIGYHGILYPFELNKKGYVKSISCELNNGKSKYLFEYNKDNYLVKTIFNGSRADGLSCSINYYYSNGNLVTMKQEYKYEIEGKQETVEDRGVYITYSDKPNTLGWLCASIIDYETYNTYLLDVVDEGYVWQHILEALFYSGLMGNPSKNLVQSFREDYLNNYGGQLSYTFDENGNITKIIGHMYGNGNDRYEWDISYEQ